MSAVMQQSAAVAPQIRSQLEADGVLLATIDMPGRSMNVFSVELMDALDALMDRVGTDPAVRSVVLTSGKPAFLAGADLDMVRGYTVSARTLDRGQLSQFEDVFSGIWFIIVTFVFLVSGLDPNHRLVGSHRWATGTSCPRT